MKSGKMKNAYNYADRKNVKYVILVAPDEWKDKKIVVKNMKETQNKQITILLDDYCKSL